MLQEERINEIRRLVQKDKKVMISDLCSRFQVSDVTIRKDLQNLTKEGLIKKMYGGALLMETPASVSRMDTPVPSIDQNMVPNLSGKESIIRLACSQIEDGDTIFLGSGTTCCLLAKEFKQFKNLTVVTNSISALGDLIQCTNKLYLIGGEVSSVDDQTYFSSIEDPSQYLKSVYVNKAFTSCSGIDLKAGITVNSIISTYMYKAIPDIKRQWYMLAEDSKYDHIGIYQVCDLKTIDYVISNQMPEPYQEYFRSIQITTILPD